MTRRRNSANNNAAQNLQSWQQPNGSFATAMVNQGFAMASASPQALTVNSKDIDQLRTDIHDSLDTAFPEDSLVTKMNLEAIRCGLEYLIILSVNDPHYGQYKFTDMLLLPLVQLQCDDNFNGCYNDNYGNGYAYDNGKNGNNNEERLMCTSNLKRFCGAYAENLQDQLKTIQANINMNNQQPPASTMMRCILLRL